MTKKMKTKSALSYFGSASEVAEDIGARMAGCSHCTILFAGGLSELPYIESRAIVANDLNDYAINFYRYASGAMGGIAQEQLFLRCEHTLSHPSEIVHALDFLSVDDWRSAWAYWAICWIQRKGQGGTPVKPDVPSVRWTASGGTNASRLVSVASDLKLWAAEFKRCEFVCEDFRDILEDVPDREENVIYSDGPWVGAGRAYMHNFIEQDHRDLAAGLDRFEKTRIVIRYDDHPLIAELYPVPRWRWTKRDTRTQANKPVVEVCIERNTKC